MAHVLIVGASKGIGLETVKQGLACGHTVRAFARSANAVAFTDPKLEKCMGNALLHDDIVPALDGVDSVIQALGVAPGLELIFGSIRLFSQSTRILVAAMQDTGVRRLICVTGFGAGDSRTSMGCLQTIPFRLLLGRAYDDKDHQESLIRDSHLQWVIVRPTILTNGPRTGRYQVLEDARDWRNGFISRADVADFLIRQIDDDTYIGKTPVLAY